ncbi:hypothetical protein H4R33_003003 [Dimargaris cristalligena]|nr:hypothetical protein H4R33_003003 [Dimargaris cristalligena]
MAKKFKGENSKVSAAKEKKAVAQAEKDNKKRVEQERKESATWAVGSKNTSKKEQEEAKRLEKLARKNEAAELLKLEEKQITKSKPPSKPASLKPVTGAAKIAIKKTAKVENFQKEMPKPVASYSASNINDALDLLSIVNSSDPTAAETLAEDQDVSQTSRPQSPSTSKPGKSVASQIQEIDRHPERRHKAAYAAYEARELPILKEEYKGLRLNQLKQVMWKNWQKSPENPFNQVHLAYNASRNEATDVVQDQRSRIEDRLRTD